MWKNKPFEGRLFLTGTSTGLVRLRCFHGSAIKKGKSKISDDPFSKSPTIHKQMCTALLFERIYIELSQVGHEFRVQWLKQVVLAPGPKSKPQFVF